MENNSQEDIQSFEAIYSRYYIPVYRFFFKHVNLKEESEDLTSDVFYSCLKNFNKYDPAKASVSTWIFVVANNKLKNYYRDKKESISIEEPTIQTKLFETPDIEGAIFLTQMKENLEEALESLPKKERAIIELRYYSELNSEEIAAEIGITAGNVRVIIMRALKKLAKYFEDNEIRWE